MPVELLKKTVGAFSKGERRTFLASLGLFITASASLVIVVLATATKAVPAKGGSYTEGLVGQPVYVNPVLANSEADKNLVRLIFSNVTELAARIERDPEAEGRVWHIRLKDNLFWHDGARLTSDDIVFTIQSIQDPGSQSSLAPSWQGVFATRLSELELQLNLASPYAFFEENLEALYVLPKHLYADVPPANWRLSQYNLEPIGSGPYRFESYDKRNDGFISSYRLSAHSKNPEGEPFIQSMMLRFFLQAEDLIKSFNAGRIDGWVSVEPDQLSDIKRPYQMFPFKLPSYYAVFFNQSKNPLLKDKAVREALSLETNRAAIAESVFSGKALPLDGPLPSYLQKGGASDALPFSPDAASALLEESGWKMNEEGKREKTAGREVIPLHVTLTVPRVPFLLTTAKQLQESWQRGGFSVEVKTFSPEEIADVIIKNRDYELLLYGNVLSPSIDLFSFWHSSERFYPGLNLSLYSSKIADALIEAIRENLDGEERAQQLKELHEEIAGDYPAIFLVSPDYLYVTTRELKGVEPGLISETSERFRNVNAWYLKTARVFK
jgi:peptide/nickel transport system substrate-binding protein